MLLEVTGPFGAHPDHPASIFHAPKAMLSGVYVYAVPVEGYGYLPTYVGETGTSFLKRVKEHFINTLGGYARIYDLAALLRGEKILRWGGLWKSTRQDHFGEFLERYCELAPVIQQYLCQLQIFLLPIDSEARLRRRIESAIANYLYKQPTPVGQFMDSDIRYLKDLPPGDARLDVEIYNHDAIFGFPGHVIV